MILSNKNFRIEEEIERYINGELNAEQIDNLWTDLIQNEYYLDYLKTIVNLKAIAVKRNTRDAARRKGRVLQLNNITKYAAVAAFLVVGIISIFVYQYNSGNADSRTQMTEVVGLAPLPEITIGVLRSGEVADEESVEWLINESIAMALTGEVDEAVEKLLAGASSFNQPEQIASILLAVGSLQYNAGNYSQAIATFASVVERKQEIVKLDLEKAYYFLGNSFLQEGENEQALSSFEEAYSLDGAYSRITKKYIDALKSKTP